VVSIAVVVWLSNMIATHNGRQVIVTPDQFKQQAEVGADLAQPGVSNFNMGKEITPQQRKDLERAAGIFDSLDDYKPTESAGYFEAGLCYYLIGDTDTALNRVQQSLNNAAVNPPLDTVQGRANLEGVVGDCHHLISLIAFDRKQYDMAISESSAALQHRNDRPLYYVARARAEIEKSSQDQQKTGKVSADDKALVKAASSDLKAALKLYPNFPPAVQLEGLVSQP